MKEGRLSKEEIDRIMQTDPLLEHDKQAILDGNIEAKLRQEVTRPFIKFMLEITKNRAESQELVSKLVDALIEHIVAELYLLFASHGLKEPEEVAAAVVPVAAVVVEKVIRHARKMDRVRKTAGK
jgi:dGTP triphosphohydrolase